MLGTALLALGITGAVAGGLGDRGSIKDGPQAAPTPVWSGLYVGAGIGYGSGSTRFHNSDPSSIPFGEIFNVSIGGTQGVLAVGYDFQLSPKWVLGLFADYAFGDIEGNVVCPGGGCDQTYTIENQWAVGGRLGFLATPSTLFHVSAGYTAAEWTELIKFHPGLKTAPTTRELDLEGYFLGVGVEQALNRNLSFKLDYRFTDHGLEQPSIAKLNNDVHSIRAGINYRFGQ